MLLSDPKYDVNTTAQLLTNIKKKGVTDKALKPHEITVWATDNNWIGRCEKDFSCFLENNSYVVHNCNNGYFLLGASTSSLCNSNLSTFHHVVPRDAKTATAQIQEVATVSPSVQPEGINLACSTLFMKRSRVLELSCTWTSSNIKRIRAKLLFGIVVTTYTGNGKRNQDHSLVTHELNTKIKIQEFSIEKRESSRCVVNGHRCDFPLDISKYVTVSNTTKGDTYFASLINRGVNISAPSFECWLTRGKRVLTVFVSGASSYANNSAKIKLSDDGEVLLCGHVSEETMSPTSIREIEMRKRGLPGKTLTTEEFTISGKSVALAALIMTILCRIAMCFFFIRKRLRKMILQRGTTTVRLPLGTTRADDQGDVEMTVLSSEPPPPEEGENITVKTENQVQSMAGSGDTVPSLEGAKHNLIQTKYSGMESAVETNVAEALISSTIEDSIYCTVDDFDVGPCITHTQRVSGSLEASSIPRTIRRMLTSAHDSVVGGRAMDVMSLYAKAKTFYQPPVSIEDRPKNVDGSESSTTNQEKGNSVEQGLRLHNQQRESVCGDEDNSEKDTLERNFASSDYDLLNFTPNN